MAIEKNKIKGASFTYAFARINEAIKQEFYLEAVTLAESVISDRLLSFVKHRDDKVNKKTTFQQLISKAQKMSAITVTTNSGTDLFNALDEWRINRNKCVHSVAKSEPGEPTISVDEFIEMAKLSAAEGKKLARMVCDWHKQLQYSSKNI